MNKLNNKQMNKLEKKQAIGRKAEDLDMVFNSRMSKLMENTHLAEFVKNFTESVETTDKALQTLVDALCLILNITYEGFKPSVVSRIIAIGMCETQKIGHSK